MHAVNGQPFRRGVRPRPRVGTRCRNACAALALWSLAVSGCYRYEPVLVAAPARGDRLNAELTDEGSKAVAALVGPRVRSVEGEFVARNDSALTLAVRIVRKENGVEDYWKGEPVSMPRAAVSRLAERRLARGRTTLVAGLAALGAVSLGLLLGDQLGSSGDVSTATGRPR